MILTVLGAPFAILFDLHGTITWSTLNALLLTACVMAAGPRTSPARMMRLVVTKVSHATRA